MSDLNEELAKWFEELQKIPQEHHLLCPRISDEDGENYKTLEDPHSEISVEEKRKRIQDGDKRIEITYWNSLIFGFDKSDAGKWLEDFTSRLESYLKHCSDCVLSWHMKRKAHLQKFAERWNEDAVAQIRDLLDRLDIKRIDHNLKWAKEFIEKIEATGAVFKKSAFGEYLSEVHIAVYEALCCVPYMAIPDQRTTFQYVFMRLQGKSYLKLGTKDPLPGMTYFLFDQKNEDRRKWAHENWKHIEPNSMSEEQFDWAVSGGLVAAMDEISKKDLATTIPETYLEIERFWLGFEQILGALNEQLILARLRSLEVRPGCPNIYELLFRHIQSCKCEGILVIGIRILVAFLKISPKPFWDVVGDARPNVIADLICGSPVYQTLLRQSLEDCWSEFQAGPDSVPFPTSWIGPWLQSIGRDRRYDACDGLLHTLFETLAKDPTIGEPGQAACLRAGFDAMTFTLETFIGSNKSSGNSHLYACGIFNVVMRYKDLILQNLHAPATSHLGWKTFHVAQAAQSVLNSAMKLDMKLFSEEYRTLRRSEKLQSTITRNSKLFWEGIVEMFDSSTQQASLAEGFLVSLEPLIGIEQIRPLKKSNQLDEPTKAFNVALGTTTDVLARIFSRISELDVTDFQNLFASNFVFQVTIGISMHNESDIGEASSELLKSWTGELSRSGAFEQITQDHPDQAIGSVLFVLDRVLRHAADEDLLPPWEPIRPILHMSRDVLRGLSDPTNGVLRTKTLEPKSVAIVLRWWQEQWMFISRACRNIESWSLYVSNSTMQEFCREIMELAEALIAEDGLITSVSSKARNKSDQEMMEQILKPAKDNFQGMENMIRLRDRWLVDVTVRVLCKILQRLRENNLEIAESSRSLILDACIPKGVPPRYKRLTNLTDQQRAELLQALGYTDDEVQVHQINAIHGRTKDQVKKQSSLDAWSKSGSTASGHGTPRTNRDDVLELSKSIDNPILKQLEARKQLEAKRAAAAKPKLPPKVPDQKAISALKESRQREKAEKLKRDAEIVARAKQLRGETVHGEGSSLAKLASLGKDHSRSEIMVNSSDEESEAEEDSDSDNQLAELSSGGRKTLDEAERRNRKALLDKTRRPVKKIKQQRSAKEMRARIIPPMDRLHNTILAWDIFHEGNDPPSGPKGSEVATKYPDPRSYQGTFFPLLASEAWRAFVTAKDEITSQPFGMKIASRASVDSYLEVTFTMPVVQNKDRGVSEGDILLVSEAEKPLLDSTAKHCLARVHRIQYKKDMIEITYRVASRNNPLSITLNPGVTVYGIKITNMTTIEREYAALESLQYYDLMDEILKAEPSPILKYGEEKVTKWMGNWSLNRGQAMAVLGAQENDGFTLIQGPPGTGKTKTIVAMVGALLSEQLGLQLGGTSIGNPLTRPGAPTPGNNQTRPKKLLVCAPSNAAVDEIVLRLMGGITTVTGKQSKVNVLRLGRSEAINAAVREVTLDEIVKKRLESDGTRDKAKADRDKLHQDAGKIREELNQLRPQLDEARGQDKAKYDTLSRHFEQLKRQQMQIGKQIDANKDSGNSIARETELRRRQIQQEVLNSAHVLCATLSGSGHEMFRNLEVEFETVIIDEAAQCVELSALIPLKYGCCKCILVGDPKQLPPTVLSQSAARFGYDQSLFVRMQQNHPKSIHLLDVQYRMHPEISTFPSTEFYERQLKDGQNMLQLRQQPWHKNVLLGPYRFFDVQGVQERGHRGQSLVNTRELDVAMQIYDRFSTEYRDLDLTRKIGIITPYKAQLFELRARFKSRYGESITDIIEFNTTDAFQGRECEIIIFSCVRASPTGGIGFMTDIRRMNVGLTRAKSSLWILGDSRALVQGEFWKKLIEDSQSRNCYTKGDILSMLRKPLEQRSAVSSPSNMSANANHDNKTMVMRDSSSSKHPVSTAKPSGQTRPATTASGPSPIPGLGSGHDARPPPQVAGLPVIHTSSERSPSDTKKRPLEGSDTGQPTTKRIASNGPRSSMMSKFGQKPSKVKPQKPPTDPSAMSVLGMVPPERPPPIPTSTPGGAPPRPILRNSSDGPVPPNPSNNKPPPPKGPKKKPSLFVPRKR
ncbi:unnamed protein product [Clonostachys rosea]|uniref:Uncharacterized protein n=1 Tax=Bionectria ochroleuca TaxID=29856 RepID=A0ABY6UTA0_BIOOC|nr:unnamed protein product [Clonostachys rosea]